MSAKLAMRVFDSALDSSLKPTAALLALFGTDDGDKIFPSIGRLAFQLGVTRRTVDRHLAQLRALGILTALGRGRTVIYRLRPDALPAREPWTRQRRLFEDESESATYDMGIVGSENRHATSATEITILASRPTTPVSQTYDPGIARSVRDPSEEQRERTAPSGAVDPVAEYGREQFARLKCQLMTAKLDPPARQRAGGDR